MRNTLVISLQQLTNRRVRQVMRSHTSLLDIAFVVTTTGMIGKDELLFLPNTCKDFIHDTAFNFYGTRMATSSSDGYIRVRFSPLCV